MFIGVKFGKILIFVVDEEIWITRLCDESFITSPRGSSPDSLQHKSLFKSIRMSLLCVCFSVLSAPKDQPLSQFGFAL